MKPIFDTTTIDDFRPIRGMDCFILLPPQDILYNGARNEAFHPSVPGRAVRRFFYLVHENDMFETTGIDGTVCMKVCVVPQDSIECGRKSDPTLG